LFRTGEVDRVDVVYTHYYSAGRQGPVTETVLPISLDEPAETKSDVVRKDVHALGATESAKGYVPNFTIEPDPATILDALFPLQAKLHLFRVYLEAATSEQIARRIAMKNATDNADEMIEDLTREYNKARQEGITGELLDIIGGMVAAEG
ncbi:MAG: F0F1 ATP synthase subunit gamma, partial [Planctomycetes bacterium]|nr:F0F1 ATP synthase subunit gamma [Planctomycetota bacterium]